MPNRSYTAGSQFRYGFNGKENDNDVKETGNQQDYGMRIYDPRIGKFLSVDPLTKKFPWLSVYQFSENNPIRFVDLDGAESFDPFTKWFATEAVITITTKPNSTKAKAFGLALGVAGAIEAPVQGTINLVSHPVRSIKAIGRMLTNTPVENAMEYAINLADKYGDLPEPVQNYAVYGYAAGDIILSLSAFKSPIKQTSSALETLKEASVTQKLLPASTTIERFVSHHIFNAFRGPAAARYRQFFKSRGINVDLYTVKIPESLHKYLHRAGNNWTTTWKKWIDEHPNATAKDVYQQAGKMMDEAGLSSQKILKHK